MRINYYCNDLIAHDISKLYMTPRLSGHFSLSGLVSFVLNSLLGIARQRSREKFAILNLKPRSHVGYSATRWKVGQVNFPKDVWDCC